jgi:uncharacterized protein GlcG (DUF336 family)
VVDRAGETKVMVRGDGSNPHTVENSRRKAYTSRKVRVPSAEFSKRVNDPANLTARQQAAAV